MTPTQIRLRIVELRSQLISSRTLHPDEERAVLEEIESLRKKLGELDQPARRSLVRQELESLAEAAGVSPKNRVHPPVHEGKLASDRRRHPRYPVTVPIRFSIAMLPTPEFLLGVQAHRDAGSAKTNNISKGGLSYLTRVPVPIGSRIEMEIPTAISQGGKKGFTIGAEIVRREVRKDGHYEIGARFLKPQELPADWITKLRVLFGGIEKEPN